MEICLTLDSFREALLNVIKTTLSADRKIKNETLDKIKELLHKFKDYQNHSELISFTTSILNRIDNSLFIDSNTLQTWINGEADPVNPTVIRTNSIDSTLPSKRAFRRNFLDNIYGDAEVVKNQIEGKVLYDFSKILLFNRDKHDIVDPRDLNQNIKAYQQELFDTILKYLKSNSFIQINESLFKQDLLYDRSTYTGAFEQWYPELKKVFGKVTPQQLLRNYLGNSKDFLDAFNAFLVLLHFDEFILNAMGDNIQISQIRTRFVSGNKYALKNKSKEMAWSNQKDDDIKVEDSINNISKMAITTTRMYDFYSKKPIENRFITTKEFIAIINKLRGLYWNPELNKYTFKIEGIFDENLSKATQKFIEKIGDNPTFAEVLVAQLPGRKIRNKEGWAAILDIILSNSTFYDELDLLEKNILYSIRTELLDNRENDDNISLLTVETQNNFILDTLIQTMEGIWPVKNCSVEEKEEGVVLQELSNSEVRRIQFHLNNDINQLNHYTGFNPEKYNITFNNKTNVWEFKIPLDTTTASGEQEVITISARFGESTSFKITKKDGKEFKDKEIYNHKTALLRFIDDILGLNFLGNIDYFNNLKQVFNKSNMGEEVLTSSVLKDLLKFSSGILVNANLSYNTNKLYELDKNNINTSLEDKERLTYFEKRFREEYGEKSNPKMVFQLQTFNLIPAQQISTIEAIAMAKAITSGVSVARQVNDNDGNALSTASPSRVVSGTERQWVAQSQDENAPCHDFLLVQEPNLCRGLYSVRDYVTQYDESKKFIEFSTREFLEDSLINSFLNPLLITKENDRYNLLNNDTIAIIPAVYSDKNTVTKMIINLKPLLNKLDIKTSKDLLKNPNKYTPVLKKYINELLFKYYDKLVTKISNDLKNLSKASIFRLIKFSGDLEYSATSYNELLKKVNKYNELNPKAPQLTISKVFDEASKETGIKLNEELHIVRTGKTITVNNTLLDLHQRYGEAEADGPKTTEFWNNKNAELFQYMLNSKASIDIHTNSEIRSFFEDNKALAKWKSKDGKLIFGEISILAGRNEKGKPVYRTYSINNKTDLELAKLDLKNYLSNLIESIKSTANTLGKLSDEATITAINKLSQQFNEIDDLEYNIHTLLNIKGVSFTVNPVLEQFNQIHYLFSQQFILSTVGSHVNHPIKKGIVNINEKGESVMSPFDFIKEESGRTNALNKRNVAHTAAVHPFQLNLKYGITDEYKITVIDDINDLMYNALGDNAVLKPFDGATYVDPYTVHLENHSLQGEAAGIHKKQFIHFYDDETGTGGIIKTAGFGITNYWIRNSPFIQRLNKKMTNEPWKNKDGSVVYLDITRKVQNADLKNNALKYSAFYKDFDVNGNEIYFKLENISYLDKGNYHLTWKQVRKDGSLISDGRVIDEFTGKMPLGFQSENEIRENIAKEGESDGVIDSTYKVYQYIFKGIKCVALDPNSKELSDKGDCGESSILNTLKVINECGFLKEVNTSSNKRRRHDPPIQDYSLDNFYQPAKHSLINYAPTAGAIKQGSANLNGKERYYTEASDLNYFKIKMNNAGIQLDKQHHADDSEISMMTQVVSACAALGHNWDESNKLYKALHNLTLQGIQSLLGPLYETLANNIELDQESKENLHKVLTTIIVKSLANGSKSKDGVIYSITSELVDKFLEGKILTDEDFRKCPLSISDPNVFNKVQSQISSILNKSSIKLKFKGILSVLIPSHEIMKIYGNKLKGSYKNFEAEIRELQDTLPRDLKTTDLMCGRTYRKIDKNGQEVGLVHIQSPFMTSKEKEEIYGDPKLTYASYYDLNDDPNKDQYTYLEYIMEGRNLAPYHCTFKYGDKTYSFYDLKVVKDSFKAREDLLKLKDDDAKNELLKQHSKKVNAELIKLSKGGPVEIVGIDQPVQITDLSVSPAEVIMPKTVATLFGLTAEDSLDKITENENFFVEKLQKNLKTTALDSSSYTVALKNISGKHVYIMDRDTYNKRKNKFKAEIYPEFTVDPITLEVIRIDSDGNELYKLSGTTDEICITEDGQEVIITDDVEFYINNHSYNTLYVSNSDKFNEIFNLDSENKSFLLWKKQLKYEYSQVKKASENLQKEKGGARAKLDFRTLFDLNTSMNTKPNDVYIKMLGREMHTSFKKYLEIIAARIPAQSMLSFMPMKIVGFDESGHNNAFVSTQQIWLQGSDFDIDCVSLLTYEFDSNGRFAGWSPFFDLSSEAQLKVSTDLNYPTGEDIIRLNADAFKQRRSKNPQLLFNHVKDIITAFTISKKVNETTSEYEPSQPFLTKEIVQIINNLLEKGVLDLNALNAGDKQELLEKLSEAFSTEFTEDQLHSIINNAVTLLQKHNLFAKTSPNTEAFTKNYIVELMIRIAKNPANLSQAHISVDQTTSIAKKIAEESKVEKLGKYVAHGNIGALLKAIEDNHVGKDVIGISAVGLKGFFALTQYTNTVLNTDPDAAKRLLKPVKFNGKEYKILANANPKSEVEKAILEALSVSNENDAALLISALLSLATDNAKELCLAKLNANAAMAGMYIYGLSIGIPFIELGRLLMSDLGNTVADLLKGSIITDKLNLYNIDKVLDFINKPVSQISKVYSSDTYSLNQTTFKTLKLYKKVLFPSGKNTQGGEITTFKTWKLYKKVLFPSGKNTQGGEITFFPSVDKANLQKYPALNNIWAVYLAEKKEKYPKTSPFFKMHFDSFIEYLISTKHYGADLKIKKVAHDALYEMFILLKYHNLRAPEKDCTRNNKHGGEIHPKILECHNTLLEALLMECKIPLDDSLGNFQILHGGAERMQLLGQLLGSNLGVKNPIEEYLNFIFTFESIKIKGKPINFEKFMTDEVYRLECLEAERKDKNNYINILDVLVTVPLYWGYMKTINTKHQLLLRGSKRYRTLYAYLNKVPATGSLKLKIQSLNRLISFKMNNDYFLDNDTSIVVPEGTPLYLINPTKNSGFGSTTITAPSSLTIKLGTLGGNAVFKNLVDTVIIPALKEGYNTNVNPQVISGLKDNKFIKSLRKNIFDKNPNRNSSISYSTDIDMSPMDERGEAILANLRQEFDILSQDFIIKDENGVELFKMPIKEIFFNYNLIVYNGALGKSTFTRILDNYIAKHTEKYRSTQQQYDLSNEVFEISDAELAAWTAQISNPFASWNEYIYVKDKASMTYQLKRKNSDEDAQETRETYSVVNAGEIDKNVILHTPTSLDTSEKIYTFVFNMESSNSEIKEDLEEDEDTSKKGKFKKVRNPKTQTWVCYKDKAYGVYVLRNNLSAETYPLINIDPKLLITIKDEKVVPNGEKLKNFIKMKRTCK